MSPTVRYEAAKVDPSPLGQPLKFNYSGRTAPNRFLKAAMTERYSSWDPKDFSKRGIPSAELINAYRRWGEGSIGLILTGNVMIEYNQLEAAGNAIIPADAPFSGERFTAFQTLASQSKAHGSLIVAQLSHPGRQVTSDINPHPISASDVQLEMDFNGKNFAKPTAATHEQINSIVNSFAHAAEFLEKAGYDGVELHGAHGYLLSQFLAPSTNQRTDQYGGSLANRARIVLEIADAVRQRVSKEFVVGIKLNSVEFQDKGFSPEEAQELCVMLEQHRFDFVELSGGTYEKLGFKHQRESTKKREGFFLEFADLIAPHLKQTRTYVTGGFKSAPAMVDALKTVHGVGLGRPLTQEPALPRDILSGKVNAAIKQGLDQDDFGITNMAAGTQIRQIGKDQEPIDLSKDENVQAFQKDMGTWAQKMGADKEQREYGYVDIESVKAVPYGTAAA